MNSKYIIPSKKNLKDTDKEDSSTSVKLQKSNIEAEDYKIILSNSENEINKDKIAAESLKKRDERLAVTKQLEQKAFNAIKNKKDKKRFNKKGKKLDEEISDIPSKIMRFIQNKKIMIKKSIK